MVKIIVSIYEVIAVVIFKGAHRIEVSGFFVWRIDSVGSETQTCGLRETYKNVHNIVLFSIFSDFWDIYFTLLTPNNSGNETFLLGFERYSTSPEDSYLLWKRMKNAYFYLPLKPLYSKSIDSAHIIIHLSKPNYVSPLHYSNYLSLPYTIIKDSWKYFYYV